MVYGPPGAGKKTRVVALLREMYGAGSERLRIEHQSFETPSKKKLEIVTVASNYHIEVNPSDVGIYDRIVIQVRSDSNTKYYGLFLIFTKQLSSKINKKILKDFAAMQPFLIQYLANFNLILN